MKFPDELLRRLWRFPTKAAQAALANRFNLPNEDWMQDWEYTVPRREQLDDYLAAYTSGYLTDDQQFLLMEMILECLRGDVDAPQRPLALRLIEENIELHLHTAWYWACLDSLKDKEVEPFDVAPAMRAILQRHSWLWEE